MTWPPVVMDFTTAWAGPLCGAVLSDLGWTVIKVETATRPDITRRLGPFAEGIAGLERSGYFDALNRGKKSVAIDLRTDRGRDIARQLCLAADAVVENFSPGVMDRLGLSYESLSREKPSLVMVSISGYGASGPERNYVAYGQTIEAVAGLDAATGYPGGGPMACGAPIPDHIAGMTGAFAIQAAIEQQRRTGVGSHVDVSMVESLLTMMPLHLFEHQLSGRLPLPRGNADDRVAPHGCYPCAGDERWVALSAESVDEWQALCHELGLDDLATDRELEAVTTRLERPDEINAQIARATRDRDADDLVQRLRARGVPATVVARGQDLVNDAHLRERGFLAEIETTAVGRRAIAGRMASLSFLKEPLQRGGPALGEHTHEVLREMLAMSDEEIRRLEDEEVLR